MAQKFFLNRARISHSQIFWGLISLAAAVLFYYLVINPFWEAEKKAQEEIILKKKILAKYKEILANHQSMELTLEKTRKQAADLQKRLIAAETLQLGAANLQDLVKRIAEKNFINLRSFRILEPKEVGPFRQVFLQIEFLPLSNMLNLSQFIYDLENQEKLVIISEIDFLVFNPRLPNAIQGNLTISALMKGNKTREKGKEK